MTCQDRLETIALLASGALDGAERDELLRHLSLGCPRCAAARAELDATVALLPLSLAPVAPPARVRQALLERVAAHPPGIPVVASSERADGARTWVRPLAAAALAAGLTAAVLLVPSTRNIRALEAQIAERDESLVRLDERLRTLEQQHREAVETAAFFGSATTAILRLGPTGTQPGAEARVFLDTRLRRAQLVASNLASPGPGRTYELWLIEPGPEGRKIPAGTFDVDPAGSGTLSVEIPADAAEIAVIAVTDEPAGGSPAPTGQIHLAGNVQASS